VRGDEKGTQCPWVHLGHPVPGRYKYGDLALQEGTVSYETIKYDRGLYGISTREWLLWQGPEAVVRVNYRPILSSEREPRIKKLANFQRTKIW
jgi:hypothetical protein